MKLTSSLAFLIAGSSGNKALISEVVPHLGYGRQAAQKGGQTLRGQRRRAYASWERGGDDRDTCLELQSGGSDCGLHVSHVGVTRGSQSFIACPRHGRLPPARLLWCRHQNGASISWRLAQLSSSNERAQLPAAAPRHPLWVWSVDGWKQSAALREVRCRHARGGLCHLESRAILSVGPSRCTAPR